MKDYDAYLFDWDGTLARTVEIWLEEIKKNFYANGMQISDADNARHFGNYDSPLLFGLPKERLAEFNRVHQDAAIARVPEAELYDDALDFLDALRSSGKKLGLVTAALPKTIGLGFEKHGLHRHFDAVVTADDIRAHKPDPEGINIALRKLNVAPDRAIMIGDHQGDLLAAYNAGTDSVLFYPESHSLLYKLDDLQKHNPTYTIRSWKEALHQLQ